MKPIFSGTRYDNTEPDSFTNSKEIRQHSFHEEYEAGQDVHLQALVIRYSAVA